MNSKKLIIMGAGGHSTVVLDALSLLAEHYNIVLCDHNVKLWGQSRLGYTIHSPEVCLETPGFLHVALGDNNKRRMISEQRPSNILLQTIIHPKATISSFSEIASGVFIAANALIAPAAILHEGCIINHHAIIDHEVHIGKYTHIAPNATLGGKVWVGENVLIGAGATLLPGICIGDNAIIGAGAVVVKSVEANTTVKGIPAK